MEKRRRTARITVRLLPIELALIRAAAREAGVPISEFVRETALREASR